MQQAAEGLTGQGPAIHPAASEGFSANAGAYAAGRPDYPAGVIDWLRDDLGLMPGRAALDLGAGTGKFLPRLREVGASVTAVEPVPAMRAELSALYPDATVLAGTAEAIPLGDACVDAVVCAQAFHWFATEAALAEIHRVLRLGGVLGLIWNVRDERVPWVAALSAIMAPYEGDTPRHHNGMWRGLFPAASFGPLRERQIPHEHRGPAEAVIVSRILSVSFIAALPEAERETVAAHVRTLIAVTPALAGKDAVVFPYQTVAYSCVKGG